MIKWILKIVLLSEEHEYIGEITQHISDPALNKIKAILKEESERIKNARESSPS